jgi:A/G-specific adenine glycosylase
MPVRARRPPKPPAPVAAQTLLDWYDRNGRDLPWRKRDGTKPDPYHVWLSEIMLQQTTVAAVIPYFHKFLALWPEVTALARAEPDAVMAAWAGLGYYARARNLIACAKLVAERPGARFPGTEAELRALPGIGAYTAAAIAAIAFGQRAAVVDANVERVIARVAAIRTPLPKAKQEIRAAVERLTPEHRPGDFAQAMMDLGASICAVRNPACGKCPWEQGCQAHEGGFAQDLPVKLPKAARPLKRATAYVILSPGGDVLLRRRPPSGLLGGLYETPSTEWGAGFAGAKGSPVRGGHVADKGVIRHGFTHFELELQVMRVEADCPAPQGSVWAPLSRLAQFGLPTLIRKVLERGLAD